MRFPTGQAASIRSFYDRLHELDQKIAAVNFAKRYPGRIEPEQLKPEEVAERKMLHFYERKMQSLSAKMRRVHSSDLDPKAKREEIESIYRLMIQQAQMSEDSAKTMRNRGKK